MRSDVPAQFAGLRIPNLSHAITAAGCDQALVGAPCEIGQRVMFFLLLDERGARAPQHARRLHFPQPDTVVSEGVRDESLSIGTPLDLNDVFSMSGLDSLLSSAGVLGGGSEGNSEEKRDKCNCDGGRFVHGVAPGIEQSVR